MVVPIFHMPVLSLCPQGAQGGVAAVERAWHSPDSQGQILALGIGWMHTVLCRERIFIELMTSDRKLKAFKEGSK